MIEIVICICDDIVYMIYECNDIVYIDADRLWEQLNNKLYLTTWTIYHYFGGQQKWAYRGNPYTSFAMFGLQCKYALQIRWQNQPVKELT
jgi:hypothetical protein